MPRRVVHDLSPLLPVLLALVYLHDYFVPLALPQLAHVVEFGDADLGTEPLMLHSVDNILKLWVCHLHEVLLL